MFKARLIFFIVSVMLVCTKQDYNPKLVEYLRKTRELHERLTEQEGLDDSIKVLQRKYKIDLDKELSKLRDDPEGWIKLLKELKVER